MNLKYLINRYKFSLILLIISIVILCFNNALGISIFNNVKSIFFLVKGEFLLYNYSIYAFTGISEYASFITANIVRAYM